MGSTAIVWMRPEIMEGPMLRMCSAPYAPPSPRPAPPAPRPPRPCSRSSGAAAFEAFAGTFAEVLSSSRFANAEMEIRSSAHASAAKKVPMILEMEINVNDCFFTPFTSANGMVCSSPARATKQRHLLPRIGVQMVSHTRRSVLAFQSGGDARMRSSLTVCFGAVYRGEVCSTAN